MQLSAQNKNILYYLNVILFMAIPIIFFQMDPIEPLTEVGMKVVGCFVAALWGWITIGLFWPSVYVLLCLTFTGYYANFNAVLADSFGNNTTVLLIFMFAFAGMIDKSGVGRAISIWFVTRKVVRGRPWLFCFAFLFSIYILGALTSGTPASLLGWASLAAICSAVGYKPGDSLAKFLFFGVLVAGPLGMDLLPFKPVSLVALSVYTNMTGLEMDFTKYVCCALMLDSLIMMGYLLFGRFILKVDVKQLAECTPEKLNAKEILKLSIEQKIVLALTVVMLAGFIAPSFMPKSWAITTFLKTLGVTGVVMVIMVIVVMLRIAGKPICSFQEIARSGISWDALLLTATVIPLTGALAKNDITGFVSFITSVVGPIIEGKSSLIFILVFMVIATIFTNFCTNQGTASSLAPIALSSAALVGANPALLIIFVIKCCHFAYFTPAASPATALAIAQPNWISQKDMFYYGLVVIAIAFAVVVCVGIPIGNIIFA